MRDAGQRVLIVEPSAAGHYLTSYVRLLVREGRARGWRMGLLTTEDATRDRAFAPVLADAGSALDVIAIDGDPSPPLTTRALIRGQIHWRRAFAEGFRQAGGAASWDAVYVNNLDRVDKAVALLGSPFDAVPYTGMLISQRFHHGRTGVRSPRTRSDALYAWLFERLLRDRALRALATIDEPLVAYARAHSRRPFGKVRYVPDPAAIRPAVGSGARARLGLPEDALVLLVYGSIERRKGVAQLLDAARRPDFPGSVIVLLAGRQDADARELLSSTENARLVGQRRIVVRPEFQDDQAEADLFSAADMIWLGYVDFYGTSGVMLQAGRSGLPVVATDEGVIGWLAARERLGPVVNPRDAAAVARAITMLAREPATRRAFGERGRAFAGSHTLDAFAQALADAIEGKPPVEDQS